jgi:hypothetical protein
MRPNKSLERTRERQSVTSEPLQPRRSAQPLGGSGSSRANSNREKKSTSEKAT